jgi:hypothetical protein
MVGSASRQMKSQGFLHNPRIFLTLILFILLRKVNKISVKKKVFCRRRRQNTFYTTLLQAENFLDQ